MVESSRCGGTALRNLSGEKGTILVVDDEANIRRILQTRLEMIGYSVVTASDGEEALSAFRLLTPDLIVLDVMMPKLDGYGVCQELRKQSDVPIIMLTALADVADRITGLELGADDYIHDETLLTQGIRSSNCLRTKTALPQNQYQYYS
jgi:OmpR family response regulator RpaB